MTNIVWGINKKKVGDSQAIKRWIGGWKEWGTVWHKLNASKKGFRMAGRKWKGFKGRMKSEKQKTCHLSYLFKREKPAQNHLVRTDWKSYFFMELNFLQMHQKGSSCRAEQKVWPPRGFHLPKFNSGNPLCILKCGEEKTLWGGFAGLVLWKAAGISFHVFLNRSNLSKAAQWTALYSC